MNTCITSRWMLLGCLTFLLGATCVKPQASSVVTGPEHALEQVDSGLVPLEKDDLNRMLLEQAVRNSLRYYNRLPEGTLLSFGSRQVPLPLAKKSIEVFLSLLAETGSWEELAEQVRQKFAFYRSVGSNAEHQVLFTGYFEPTIVGSLIPDEHYRFPIYGVPDDLVQINLGRFGRQYQGVRLVGRYDGKEMVPYYSRKEIDSDGVLAGKGYELVWLADPIERFFLQIQGSGRIRLLNGDFLQVNYAASNGRPYRSIGKLLIEKDLIPKEEMSMQAIRRHLMKHQEDVTAIFNHNSSYIFFRIVDKGPLGSISVPITEGRSIATDPRLFPRGALAFIECEKPIFAQDGVIKDWQPFSRYVLNQDAGGAIRGPGRVDLFHGSGAYNRIAAGHLKHYGTLYFLVLKE